MPCTTNQHHKVSFIIPTYQEEEHIKGTLEQLIEHFDAEIIVVDSGANGTSEIAKGFNPKVKVFKHERKGVSAARNFGALKSSGDILIFLDADVKFPCININLGKYDALISYAEASNVSPLTELFLKVERFVIKCLRPLKFYTRGDAIIVKRDVFFKSGMFDENINCMEITDLLSRISKKWRIGVLPAPVKESGRRLEKQGSIRNCMKWLKVFAAFYLGSHVPDYYKDFGVVR